METGIEGRGRRLSQLVWLGPLVIFCGAVSYFIVFTRFAVLRDFPWVNLPLVLTGLVLSAVGLWRPLMRPDHYRGRILGAIGFVFSLAIALFFNLYIFHISYQLPAPSEYTTGLEVAPDFLLSDQEGRPVRLSEFRGRKVVLTFYRGFW